MFIMLLDFNLNPSLHLYAFNINKRQIHEQFQQTSWTCLPVISSVENNYIQVHVRASVKGDNNMNINFLKVHKFKMFYV